jgi:hypothetical protein
MPQTIFQANLNAATMFIDLANMPATTIQAFEIYIQNQSLVSLYFKLNLDGLPSWSMSNPATGKLGVVAAGSSSYDSPQLQRATPTSDTMDSGIIRLEVYNDSGYTTMIDYADLAVTVYLEDTEHWSNVTIEPFAVGNSYGWTGGTLINNVSVEVGGYSYESTASVRATSPCVTGTVTLTRTGTILPVNNKIRMTFYGCLYFNNQAGVCGGSGTLQGIAVTVNGITVYDTGYNGALAQLTSQTYSALWLKFTCDLSAYSGQTVTIAVIATLADCGNLSCGTSSYFIMDRVVRAGNN